MKTPIAVAMDTYDPSLSTKQNMVAAIEADRAQRNDAPRYIVDEENVAIRDTFGGDLAEFVEVNDDVRASCDRLNSGEDPHDTYSWWDPKEGS